MKKISQTRGALLGAAAVLFAASVVSSPSHADPPAPSASAVAAGAGLDFNREPDAVIASKSLSALPKDILAVPVLKDLLTEDFVFYYRDSGADWLSFRGALARIAYEKQTDWPTRLMSWLMNGPAEVALWKGPEGRLNHFMVVIDQTGVKALTASILKSVQNQIDAQMTTKQVGGRSVHTITTATQHTVYLTTEENRIFLYSDESMTLPTLANGRTFSDRAKSFFGASEEIGVFAPKLGTAQHSVTVSGRFLSFGYQAFFNSVKGLRFDFKASNWESRVLTTGEFKPADAKDWTIMPRGAAFCLSVPLDKKKIGSVVAVAKWLQKAESQAVACWYHDSKIYSPLIGVRGDFAALMAQSDELKAVFASVIGNREASWSPAKTEGEAAELKLKPALAIREEKKSAKRVAWTREVGGRYGIYPASKSKESAKLGSKRFFRVKLVASSDSVLFSPDDQLVDRALTTLDGKLPSMAASLPAGAKSAAIILAPEGLAKLAKQSVLDSLPQSQEAIFRTAVSRHLFPNLEKFGKRPAQAATVGASDSGGSTAAQWKKLNWTSNASR